MPGGVEEGAFSGCEGIHGRPDPGVIGSTCEKEAPANHVGLGKGADRKCRGSRRPGKR